MSKSLKVILLLLIFAAAGFMTPAARADGCSASTALDFVAKDPSGSFIPGARIEVYKQVTDTNGQSRPGTKVASATVNATLGSAHLSWKNSASSDIYAIKVQTITKDNASFWYFGQTLDCGQSLTLSKTLSGIQFTIHKTDGSLLTNTAFNVYSQFYDESGQPLNQTKELLASLNSGASGQVKVYLPQGSVSSLDKSLSDHYTLEITRSGRKFDLYGIKVEAGKMTTVNYYVTGLRIKLQDATGALFPTGTKVEVFKQEVDEDNVHQKGTKVGDFTLSDDGYGNFESPLGLYVLGVKDKSGSYQYFWNVEVIEGKTNQYTLTSEQGTEPVVTSCQNSSQFTLTLRNFSGEFVTGLKYELYEQSADADGVPVAGNKVGGGTIASSGKGSFSFKPDPRKLYALKVYDRRSDLGELWFYSAVRFVCDYDRALTESIPALKIVLRDNAGNLRRNYNFSLYAQEYDADNHPFFQSKDLIANLTTDGGGQAIVYVSPFNTYRRGLTGDYAISAKDASGNVSNFYNIHIPADKDYRFESVFSGLAGELRDARSRALANREIDLYESSGLSGRQLIKTKTDASGLFKFEYPAGTYTLAALDDFGKPGSFGNVALKSGSNFQKLVMGTVSFSLSNSQSSTANTVALYALQGTDGTYYRDRLISSVKLASGKSIPYALAAGPYLAVFTGAANQEFGTAFVMKNGSAQNISIATNSQYVVSAGQGYKLSVSAPSSSAATGTPAASGSLLKKVKGRILLQVEDQGQAWYVSPVDYKKYYLGRPSDAFEAMRELGLGISNGDFTALEKKPSAWKKLAGRILIKTEDKGQAYYFDPADLKLYYLGRPSDAFNVMRSRGLGVKTSDINTITTAVK